MRITSSLKRHGGKHYLSSWIMENKPDHFVHFVDCYCGAMSELFALPPGHSEVVNDLDGLLMNFWRCLQCPQSFERLVRRAQATPVAQEAGEEAQGLLRGWEPSEDAQPSVEAAWAFFVSVRQSRQGLQRDFATLSKTRTRRGINEQASAWLGAIEGLPEVHARLQGVVLLNKPALEVIRSEDSLGTWFYLDPPYHPDTRVSKDAYQFEMSHEDHIDLLDALASIKGRFMLSGYDCPLYQDALDLCGWRKIEKEIPNHASGKKTKEIKRECLWMNYDEKGDRI